MLLPPERDQTAKPHSQSGSVPRHAPYGTKPERTQGAACFLEEYVQPLSSALLHPDCRQYLNHLPRLCHADSLLRLFTPLLIHWLPTWIATHAEGGPSIPPWHEGAAVSSGSDQETATCCDNSIMAAISRTWKRTSVPQHLSLPTRSANVVSLPSPTGFDSNTVSYSKACMSNACSLENQQFVNSNIIAKAWMLSVLQQIVLETVRDTIINTSLRHIRSRTEPV